MATLIVEVTPECEGLISTLPRGMGWSVEDESYREDGSGTITISFDGNDTSIATELALDSNPDVISYKVEN